MENNILLTDRELLISKLAVFLDTARRDQLSVDDLLELQDAKSKTDRSVWRSLRKEAKERAAEETDGAKECIQVFKSSPVSTPVRKSNDEKESTAAVTDTPKSISRRFLQRESHSDGAHRSPLQAPMECDVMMASGVLPNSQPSPVENRGEEVGEEQLESARRAKTTSSRRKHREDKVRDILASEASLDLSQGRHDSELSQMGTISADVSPLASDGSMSDDNSPQNQRRIRRLEEALTEARNDALSWKERCLILESLLAESEKQRGKQGGGGGERLCTPERRVGSDDDQGWKVHQDSADAALSVGGNILSSPVTRSLHKTLSDEATAIESVTKQLLEGDEEIGDVASLLTRISSLRRDISVISDMTRDDKKENLCKIGEQIGAYEDYIGSMQREVSEKMLGDKEDMYIEEVKAQYDVVDVDPDGNCLFAASSLGNHALSLVAGADVEAERPPRANGWRGEGAVVGWVGEAEMGGPRLAGAGSATEKVKAMGKDERQKLAVGLRAQVVQLLLDQGSGEFSGEISMTLKEALNGSRMDATSVALREEAAKRWGEETVTDEMLNSDEAVEVYSNVMSREGVFGERLEISAISRCLTRPVHIFYYDSAHKEGDAIKASEKFGEELEGEAVLLLHMIQGNHFQLMRPLGEGVEKVAGPSSKAAAPSVEDQLESAPTPRKNKGAVWRFLCG